MTHLEITDVQLEFIFGSKFPHKIQQLVEEELKQGRWVDGYEIAIAQGVIDGKDAHNLLQIVLREHPDLLIDRDGLTQTVARMLPQSFGASVLWIVEESGSFALTDSLRVARFEGSSIVWRSPRISHDGIEFDSLVGGLLRGRSCLLSSSVLPDSPFTFDFDTGELIDGKIVEHE